VRRVVPGRTWRWRTCRRRRHRSIVRARSLPSDGRRLWQRYVRGTRPHVSSGRTCPCLVRWSARRPAECRLRPGIRADRSARACHASAGGTRGGHDRHPTPRRPGTAPDPDQSSARPSLV